MKQFENRWIFEPFEEKPDCVVRSMFGGLAMYYQGQLKLVLMENVGARSYRGRDFDFDIWNGLMLATEREKQALLTQEVNHLVPHPVLPKWLFLPFAKEGWEEEVHKIHRLLRRGDPLIGVWPQQRSKKKKKPASKKRALRKKTSKKS